METAVSLRATGSRRLVRNAPLQPRKKVPSTMKVAAVADRTVGASDDLR
jgi:hypothetical protein